MSLASAVPPAAVPAHALRRGTRGFAAVVLFLTGMIVSAVTLFVLPSSAIGSGILTILIPLAVVFSIAHFVAIYGVLRRKAWVVSLTMYVVAIGLGLVAFMALLIRGGIDPLAPAAGASSDLSTIVGPMVWLASSWLVVGRFVARGMAPPELRPASPEPAEGHTRVKVANPIVVALDATRPRAGLRPHSA
jgi:hypothetical protein